MKNSMNYLLIFTLIVPTLLVANDFTGRYTREKKLAKSYKVTADAKLLIENKFGNVEITPWDRDEISIEVVIRTTGTNESKVEDKLDDIDVSFNGTKYVVSAKTHIESNSNWFNWFNSNVSYKINYFVHVPVTNDLDIQNKYGDTYISESKGKINLTHDYGTIILGSLYNDAVNIDMDYSKLEADYMKQAIINIDYTDISIDEIHTLDLESDYGHIQVGKSLMINYDMDYGSISIGAVNKIVGNSDYTDVDIEQLGSTAQLSADYGKIAIKSLSSLFDKISIDTDYTGIKIGYSEDSNFSFNINTKYTDVNGIEGDRFNLHYQNQKTTSAQYKGDYGTTPSKSHMELNTSYGNITLRKKFN